MASEPRLSSLQQERSRETRRRLIEAARKLWTKQGFDETTVSEICREAGVAKGTFYFYFPRKEDLLLEIGTEDTEPTTEALQEATGRSEATTEDLLKMIVWGVARYVEQTPKPLVERTILELYRSVDGEARGGGTTTGSGVGFGVMFPLQLAQVFRRAVWRGEIPRTYWPIELSSVLSVSLLQATLSWSRGQSGNLSLPDLLWRRVQLFMNGACGAAPGPLLQGED